MARSAAGLGKKIAPPRFVLFLVLLVAGFLVDWLAMGATSWTDAVAMAFDLAAFVFLLSLIPVLRDTSVPAIRRHAAENDANRLLVLIITTVVTMVVMAAIAGELPKASDGDRIAMAKLVATLVLTWLFANTVYALHYAHLYYSESGGGDRKGIDFPGEDDPDYLDFVYFSFTLGMTFQTSDTQISARPVRRIATLHSFAAFIFNIGVIAFTINAIGGS